MANPAEATYVWPEPAVAELGGVVHYDAILRESGTQHTVFRVGDVVLLESGSAELPFLALVEKLWESADGEMMLTARWFYRPEDASRMAPLPSPALEKEILLSTQVHRVVWSWGPRGRQRAAHTVPTPPIIRSRFNVLPIFACRRTITRCAR